MAVFFDTEGDAKTQIGTRDEVWAGFECPFKGNPTTQIMCGNWCALFEYDAYDGTPAVGAEVRKAATLKCGVGTRTLKEVVVS